MLESCTKEKPRLSAGPSSTYASPELAIGILLLLAGLLLPTTLLLLTWLLTGGLVLLARILIGIAHSGFSLVECSPRQLPAPRIVARNIGSMKVIPCRRVGFRNRLQKQSCTSLLGETARCCRSGFPLLRTGKTRRLGLPGKPSPRRLEPRSPWSISPSNSSTVSCSARSTG